MPTSSLSACPRGFRVLVGLVAAAGLVMPGTSAVAADVPAATSPAVAASPAPATGSASPDASPDAALVGTVVDAHGVAASGIRLTLLDQGREVARATSAATGGFSVRGLPSGDYTLDVEDPSRASYDGTWDPIRGAVVPGGTATVHLDARAVPLRIALAPRPSARSASAPAASPAPSAVAPRSKASAREATVPDETSDGTTTLTGTLTVAGDSTTVAGAYVAVYAIHDGWQDYVTSGVTDDAGVFSLDGLTAGDQVMLDVDSTVVAWGFVTEGAVATSWSPDEAHRYTVPDGEWHLDIALPAATSISGTVEDPDGAPVGDVYLQTEDAEGSSGSSVYLDPDGDGTFTLPAVPGMGVRIRVTDHEAHRTRPRRHGGAQHVDVRPPARPGRAPAVRCTRRPRHGRTRECAQVGRQRVAWSRASGWSAGGPAARWCCCTATVRTTTCSTAWCRCWRPDGGSSASTRAATAGRRGATDR